MRFVHLFCCFVVLLSSAYSQDADGILGPRGNRPVEQGYKSEGCATEKAWPVCTDEDWGPKCPSGCRIAGLIDEADKELAAKIDKIRKFLEESRRHYRSTDQATKQAYDFLREKLVTDTGNDDRYLTLAEQLRQRIVSIKIKIDTQLRLLQAMKERVRSQVREMQRLETDIDIKLRSCKGSCSSYTEYIMDRESYETLEKQFAQLDSMSVQSVETVTSLRTMKSRRLKDEDVPSIYKSGLDGVREEQKQDYFADVGQVRLTLEGEGGPSSSSSSPSTSSSSTSSSSTSSSSTSSSSKSSSSVTSDKATGTTRHVTSPAGSSTGTHTTVHTVKCTKTIRKSVTYTKDGPVEKTEIVGEGPGCEGMGELGLSEHALLTAAKEGKDISGDGYTVKVSGGGGGGSTSSGTGGMTSLFPEMSSFFDRKAEMGFGSRGDGGLGHTESHTYRQTSKQTSHSSSSSITDGSLKGFSTSFMGEDLGEFMQGEVEEDLPDIHARSLRGPSGDRQRDYAGKDCVDIIQKHASGAKSGLFKIKPGGSEEVVVYCDQDTMLGGWVLVQQRMDGSVNFNRTWKDYRNGFGSVDQQGRGELWLGNKYLHLLTQAESILRIELVDWEGKESYAEYSIRVGPEAEGYPLGVSEYQGDAGDALVRGQTGLGAFLSHANMKFSTYDRDNDKWEENCAEMYGGGWWYNNCQSANLNGIYYKGGQYDPGSNVPYEIENGVVWLPLKPADYSLKIVRMKVRPVETM
ncbi:fibrinogen alpha chain [Megalops cyprinoides]|uniref:fibrinogen alpha chain n=1 Tax=Megalops cyprinoides TaxID=118141 RepID=UPI001864D622|nr:fibrinogen alpha chain [Megalops cyprinoides]